MNPTIFQQRHFSLVLFFLLAFSLLIFAVIIRNFYLQKLRKQHTKIQYQELYYKSLFDLNPDSIIMLDTNGTIIKTNEAAERLSHLKNDDIIGKSFLPFVHVDDRDFISEVFSKCLHGEITEYEIKMYTASGEILDIFVKNIPIMFNEKIIGIYGVIRDVTDYKRQQHALKAAESRYRSIVEESFVAVFISQNERIIFANAMMAEMFGYSVEELLTFTFWEIIFEEDHQYVRDKKRNRLMEERKFEHYEIRGRKKDGEIFYLKAHASECIYENEPAVTCSVIDITDEVKSMRRIEFLAYHNPLTNLRNRRKLIEDLGEKISYQHSFSLFFLDLNEFKRLNDRFGHMAGDTVLIKISKRITELPFGAVAYHIGGDEFSVILPEVDDEIVRKLATYMAAQIRLPTTFKTYLLTVSSSIGVAKFPRDGTSIEDLLRRADLAMYAAKEKQQDSCVFYQEELLLEVENKFHMEEDVKVALSKRQFLLYFQPQFNLLTGALTGVETLLRWNHPEKGVIGPSLFIPLLEETGLIVDVGEWVVREAIDTIKDWLERGFEIPEISVNVSAKQLNRQNLDKLFEEADNCDGACLKKLNVELTESAVINLEHSLDALERLQKLGIKISLDDFGTGYSSLSYLHRLPIDFLKIDRSFVMNLNQGSQVVIEMILQMAKRLHVQVIAEGIENKEQLDFLIEKGCQLGQGYFFSKPLPKKEFETMWLM